VASDGRTLVDRMLTPACGRFGGLADIRTTSVFDHKVTPATSTPSARSPARRS